MRLAVAEPIMNLAVATLATGLHVLEHVLDSVQVVTAAEGDLFAIYFT